MGLRVDQRLEMDEDLYDNRRSLRNVRPMNRYRAGLRSQRVAATNEDADDDEGNW